MLLESNNAVTHAAGGAIGGAVVCAFASEGTAVFLAGRTREPLQVVADITVAARNT